MVLDSIDGSVILLTYKGKVLLTLENASPIRSKADVWSFLTAEKKRGESFEDAICRCVESKTSIRLKGIELLSHWAYRDKRKYFYSTNLTDEQVNGIQRADGETIDFFSVAELEKLPLAHLTRLFIEKHRDVLERGSHSAAGSAFS